MGILFAFTILFVTMTFYIYHDFGWKIYKHVDCNHQMRSKWSDVRNQMIVVSFPEYYQWYEAVSSGIKLVILFTVSHNYLIGISQMYSSHIDCVLGGTASAVTVANRSWICADHHIGDSGYCCILHCSTKCALFTARMSMQRLSCILFLVSHLFTLQIHYNSFTGYLLIAITGILLFFYYAFKIERYQQTIFVL